MVLVRRHLAGVREWNTAKYQPFSRLILVGTVQQRATAKMSILRPADPDIRPLFAIPRGARVRQIAGCARYRTRH
jgi:hypothetical protein